MTGPKADRLDSGRGCARGLWRAAQEVGDRLYTLWWQFEARDDLSRTVSHETGP